MKSLLALPFLLACGRSSGTIDGLPPAENPDEQYIEWVALPQADASVELVGQVIADSERTPIAFIGASWCGSCRAYKATLDTPRMKSVHASVQIVELDLDHHKALLTALAIHPAGVPHWEALTNEGRSTGHRIDGRAWKHDTLDEMAPVLDAFYQEATRP
jgi:thiol-disulfide isomerase/thioredoxin